jgi:protein O-mannosyl-transferase
VLSRLRPYIYLPLLGLLLVITWLAYAPGLAGGFLFDDFANLPSLGATGPIDHWPIFWRYISDGHADPIGRPLAQLSFLLDARDWPANPFSFKRTNLLLHLLNGVLLTYLLRQLGRARIHSDTIGTRKPDSWSNELLRVDQAALLGAAFWLLHPLFVSTTLYVVQREAMLPATFTLLGLLLWMHGRNALRDDHAARGVIWITLGLGGCTTLALLSKANGILLPALALVIEYVWLRSDRIATNPHAKEVLVAAPAHSRGYRWVMCLLAWIPTILVVCYLLQQGWSGMTRGIPSIRPWTLGQRLLTEPRVLVNYLELLWLPRSFTPGLFNDQIQVSTSLLSPPTTSLALLTILGLIIGAWLARRRWPALTLAIWFYFVGQSLESSTVPLELYFEHRNYLPALLMFWPLALWLCNAYPNRRELPGDASTIHMARRTTSHGVRAALAALILLGLGLMTHACADLWGDTNDQALLWAKLNPDSPRAQAYAAEVEMASDHASQAIIRLTPLLTKYPDQVQLALNLFGAECQLGHVDQTTINAAVVAIRTTRDPGTLLTSWFVRVIDESTNPPCPQLTYDTIATLLNAALTNPYLAPIAGRQQDIYYLKGRLALKQGDAETALNDFNHALDLQIRAPAALEQAALLGASGYPQLGLAHLNHYEAEQSREATPDFGMPRVHAWILRREQYWPHELAHLRATLQRDAASHKTSAIR